MPLSVSLSSYLNGLLYRNVCLISKIFGSKHTHKNDKIKFVSKEKLWQVLIRYFCLSEENVPEYFEWILNSFNKAQFSVIRFRVLRILYSNNLYDLYTNHQQEILVTLCDLKGIFELKLCYNNENLNNA